MVDKLLKNFKIPPVFSILEAFMTTRKVSIDYDTKIDRRKNDYKNMQTINTIESVPFPGVRISENFTFDCSTSYGNFIFHFKWLNDRWNLWVTTPEGNVRQAGVYPGVTSWSEFSDYGIMFKTNQESIDYNSLFNTEMYLIKWL